MRGSQDPVHDPGGPERGPADTRSSLRVEAGSQGKGSGWHGGRHDGLIPPKLYRIGEIVDYSGLSRQTIHNYTTMGLLRESRWTRGGHRLYDESVFERLHQVLLLKRQRKSMQEIRECFSRLDTLQ
jgi:hypothetical protein